VAPLPVNTPYGVLRRGDATSLAAQMIRGR
jgi:hypothetical protein